TMGFAISALGTTQVEVGGNIKIYVENTTDITFLKSTTWTTLITGMTLVYDGPLNIAPRVGGYDIRLDVPFILTGSNMYISFDWEILNPSPVPTVATQNAAYTCTADLVGGAAGNRTGTTTSTPATTTLTASSNWRPSIRFGQNATLHDAEIVTVYTLADKANPAGNPHQVQAIVKNNGANPLVNYPVALKISGTNMYADTQYVNLNFNQSTLVNFASYTAAQNGQDSILVSVGPDSEPLNNEKLVIQNVNPSTFSYGKGPATGGVGYATGAGFLLNRYYANDVWFIDSVRVHLADNTNLLGNSVYAVVLNAAGNIIGTSNPITVTNADLNVLKDFKINDTLFIHNAHFYVGIAQTANTTLGYHPMGTIAEAPARDSAYFGLAGLTGGGSPTNYTTLGRFLIEAAVKTIPPPFSVSLGNDTIFCQGDSIILNAGNPGLNYLWSNGSTGQTLVVKTPGTYFVKVTDSKEYPVFDTIVIMELPNLTPLATVTSNYTGPICDGMEIIFEATATNEGSSPQFYWVVNSDTIQGNNTLNYSSNTFANGDVVTFKLTSSETCVTISDAASTPLTIDVNPLPTVDGGAGHEICEGDFITLTATGNAINYQWNNNVQNGVAFIPVSTDTFMVTGTDVNGCINKDSVIVIVNLMPIVDAGNDITICSGNMITLTASGNAMAFDWSQGVVDGVPFEPLFTFTYTLTGISAEGCIETDDITITVNPTITATLAPFDTLCINMPGIFLSGGEPMGGYYGHSGLFEAFFDPAVAGAGSHAITYTYTTPEGCADTATQMIVVHLCTSIEQALLSKPSVNIYPNPANAYFAIDVTSPVIEEATLILYNLNGQVVLTEKLMLDKGSNIINVNSNLFARGVYHLNITTGTFQMNKKVVLN
ncbi:MAG: T9SS type A sorting domain-containing protein, partial [Bacteroidetes bacterium]|nr:T9SS type A sorting domain-containing protein [Bacteroidota bacterium]